MQSAFRSLLRGIGRYVLALLLIALMIIAAQSVQNQWKRLDTIRADAADIVHASVELQVHRHSATALSIAAMHSMSGAPLAVIDQRIAALEASLLRHSGRAERPGLMEAARSQGGLAQSLASSATQQINVELQTQELAYLQRVRAYATGALANQAALVRLAQLRRQHHMAYAKFQENERVLEGLGPLDQLRYGRPWSHNARLTSLARSHRQLLVINQQAAGAYRAQLEALSQFKQVRPVAQFVVNPAPLDAVHAHLADRLVHAQSQLNAHWMETGARLLLGSLPMAVAILLGSIAAHLGLKSVFYFVLAPLAARRPPIVVAPEATGRMTVRRSDAAETSARAVPQSRVSQVVTLGRDEHMLVLPDYMQSATLATLKDTKWLLDWSHPATSLLAGMVNLTRLRPTSPGQQVVLSSGRDPMSELALIDLDAGAAMVFHPRALVGVLFPVARPLCITSHWRIASLHAWLTFQWRYLVFHGPVTLAVRGTRGVRAEQAEDGRAVAQWSTLGFSANLHYATVRTDPFFPYFRGQAPLLQDVFSGADGYYVVDETVANAPSGRLNRWGLEGVASALLRIFGI